MQVRWLVFALLVSAATVFGAGEARAQACAAPDVVVDGLYDFYVDQLGDLPHPGPDACSKLTKGAVRACHKLVSDTFGCYESLYRAAFKGQKIACGATEDPAQCSASYKGGLEETLDQLDALSGAYQTECDEGFADSIYFTCVGI